MTNRSPRNIERRGVDVDDEDDDIVIIDESGTPIEDDDGGVVINDPVDDDHTPDEDHTETDRAAQLLQQRFDAMQRERDQERQRAQQLDRQLAATEEESISNAWLAVEQAEITAAGQIETAKQIYAAALDAGDYKAAADAQVKLIAATSAVGEVASAKRQLEDQFGTPDKPRQRERPKPAQQQPAPTSGGAQFDHTNPTQVEAVYQDLSPATQTWTRKHHAKMFGDNQTVFKAVRLHGVATQQLGIKPDTPEYFDFLEKHLGFEAAPASRELEPKPRPQVQQRRRPAMAAAPSNRGGAPAATVEVTLTKEQREIARRQGMSLKAYAKQVDAITKGAKDPSYRGPVFTKDQRQ